MANGRIVMWVNQSASQVGWPLALLCGGYCDDTKIKRIGQIHDFPTSIVLEACEGHRGMTSLAHE